MNERWNEISSSGKIDLGDQTIVMDNFLEIMHGANEWHLRAQWVYCQSIGMDFRGFKEALHMGRQFREQGDEPKGYLRKFCLDLLNDYEHIVEALGEGITKKYVLAMGKDRHSVDQAIHIYWQENS